jgi:hypothetical protein
MHSNITHLESTARDFKTKTILKKEKVPVTYISPHTQKNAK